MRTALRLIVPCLAVVAAALQPALADQTVNGVGIAMHGEPKYKPGFKHFDYVNPKAPKGGEVKLAAVGGFDTMNPYIIKGRAAAGIGALYDTLMVSSADEPFSIYGLLAENIECPADRSWVAFTLNPKARWHDGKPVTPEDIVFSFNILMEKGAPLYRFYFGSVEKVEKTGERSVKFTFKPGENRELPLIIGHHLPILPKHYWETRDFEKTTLEPPLGNGAYKIDSVDTNRSITYRRVPDYWGKDLPVNIGRENFEVIRYEYFRDQSIWLEAFKANGYDFRLENSAKEWATAYDIPALKNGSMKKEAIPNSRTQGMQGWVFNMRKPLFQDRRVREAIINGFDFEWMNKALAYGQYTRSRSFWNNSELESKGLPSAEELKLLEPFRGQIPEEVFTTEYNPPKTDGSGNNREQLRHAAELLKQAGWTVKQGKLVNDKGEQFSFEILLSDPTYERSTIPFAKNLERLGMEVRVRSVDTAQYQKRTDDFDFDMTIDSWPQSESPGNEQRDHWGTAAADHKGSRNSASIKSKAVDSLVEAIIAAPDRKSLVARTHALDRVLQWTMFVVPQFYIAVDRVAYWDKFGRPQTNAARGVQFDAWWIDAEKAATLPQRKAAAGN